MEENELVLSKSDQKNFLETAKWGKFLSIVGFVMSGFMILAGLVMMGSGSLYNELPFAPGAFGLIYILISLIYIFPSLYLLRFSNQVQRGIREQNQVQCSEAYNNLRRLFLFMGVFTIIMLSLYILIILFALMGGLMGGML
ncbi:hypothetical protein [Ekhidna sp. To15]|uniref:hypothetical protein n=1 Tax=Ekhidna sp. To15 TaxID=3395267 RepID=UPI003F5211D7